MKRSWLAFLTGFAALIVLASFVWKGALWGVSAWGVISPLAALAGAIVIVPQFFLRQPFDPFGRLPRIRPPALRFIVIVGVAIVVLWVLRWRHELWGERFSLVSSIEASPYRAAGPLATFLQWAIYRFMNAVFLSSPDAVITWVSIAAGALFAGIAVQAADLLFDDADTGDAGRLAAAVLLTGGFTALFFGAGGNVPVALAAVAAFIVQGLRHLRGKTSLVLPAVLLVLAVLSHVSAAYLVVPFAVLAARGLRSRESRRGSILAGIVFVLGLAAGELALTAVARRLGAHAGALSMTFALDRRSLSDALNTLLILGPAPIAAVLLLASGARKRGAARPAPGAATPESGPPAARGAELVFLAACALAALAAVILGSALVDGGLRWHILATAGPSLSIYAVWALRRELGGPERFARVASALFLLGVLNTLPLVIVDAVPAAAEKRLLALPLAPGRAEMIIGDFALEDGEVDTARTWYTASLDKNKRNETVELRLGRIAMQQEEYPEAITHFLNAHELDRASPHDRFELAEALIAKRWFPEAIAQLETLTVAYPDSVAFWRKLGFARNNGDRFAAAIEAYEEALSLEPGNEENVRNLVSALLNRAAELQLAKQYEQARALYTRAIAMYPHDWRAYNNLALIEMREGNLKRAYEILDGALQIFPFETSLHFNMGLVLEKLGRYKEALVHMETARELDPVYSQAPYHIERLEKRLGITHAPAPRDSTQNPVKGP
jgi:tetratricopeptide (TPR) repeat protein